MKLVYNRGCLCVPICRSNILSVDVFWKVGCPSILETACTRVLEIGCPRVLEIVRPRVLGLWFI